MSYDIIRNAKYKRENLKGIYRHNKRRNFNYSNKNIDKEKTILNYSLKAPQYSYEKEFDRLKKEYNLKGQIKTIAILSYLNMEYLLNDEQKELMRKIHKSNEEKLEKNKHEKYNYNNLFKKANTENIKEEVALVEIKEEKWYKKVFTFLKRFFIKNK